ncbi:unnamed protein product [Agarophyton chilense]
MSLAFARAGTILKYGAIPTSGQKQRPSVTLRRPSSFTRLTSPRIFAKCTHTLPPPKASSPSQSNPTFTKPSAAPQLTAEGDSVQSTPTQRFLLNSFGVTSLAAFAQVFSHMHGRFDFCLDLLVIFASYVFTDFAIGVYHHAVDNYGSKHTPVVGYQIDAFQGHHRYPWTITSRDMPNNLYRLTIVTIPQLLLLLSSPLPGSFKAFYSSFLFFVVLSQETHRQAHMTRAAPWVRALQKAGLIVSQKAHAAHHRSSGAYEGNYCILSGWWNGFLDQSGFFRLLEAVIFKLTGNEPICWNLDHSLKTDALRRLPELWR